MAAIAESRARALRHLIPPPRLKLSDWIEANLVLPAGTSALPGRVRLFPYQREIADAINDPLLERVTLLKATRVGFSSLLTAAIGSYVVNDPAPILLLCQHRTTVVTSWSASWSLCSRRPPSCAACSLMTLRRVSETHCCRAASPVVA